MSDTSTAQTSFAQGQLRSLIERIERLEEEKKALAGDIRDRKAVEDAYRKGDADTRKKLLEAVDGLGDGAGVMPVDISLIRSRHLRLSITLDQLKVRCACCHTCTSVHSLTKNQRTSTSGLPTNSASACSPSFSK